MNTQIICFLLSCINYGGLQVQSHTLCSSPSHQHLLLCSTCAVWNMSKQEVMVVSSHSGPRWPVWFFFFLLCDPDLIVWTAEVTWHLIFSNHIQAPFISVSTSDKYLMFWNSYVTCFATFYVTLDCHSVANMQTSWSHRPSLTPPPHTPLCWISSCCSFSSFFSSPASTAQ